MSHNAPPSASPWAEAARFLEWLDPAADGWAFRTLTDAGTGTGHNFTGTLVQHVETLAAENAAARGVFVVVNAGGHRGAEIERVRAVFADLDGAPLEPVTAGPLAPHIVLESSPGRWHCYWLCDGVPLEQFGLVQRTIAARFGGDASVCDLPRVMRLPGFLHRKRDPAFLSRVVQWNGHARYTAAQVLEAFPPAAAVASTMPSVSVGGVNVEDEGTRHADLVALCARLARAGLSLDTARAAVQAEADRGRWSRDVAGEIEAALQSAFTKLAAGEIARPVDPWALGFGQTPLPEGAHREPVGPALRPVPVEDVLSAFVPPPRFVVDPLIPAGHVTLFGSHGGAGKSLLALTLAAHVAAGVPWATLSVHRCPVLFVSLEDAGAIVRHRLRKVVEAYRLDVAAVAAGLRVVDGSEGTSALMSESVSFGVRTLCPTATLAELRAMVSDAGLVVVDNASDAYDGPENDRRQVRTFIRTLAALGPAVLLLAHIDKAAARFGAAGQSFSGSTAWHNSARSRLALLSDRAGPSLVQEKLNLGKVAEPVRLEWSPAGVLVPAGTDGAGDGTQCEADAASVLQALEAAARDGVDVPTARTGPATTQRVLENLPDLPAHLRGARGREEFWAAIAELQRSGRIAAEEFLNAQRKRREKFAVRHCASSAPTTKPARTSEPAQGTCANAPVPAQGVRGIGAYMEPAQIGAAEATT